MKYLIHLILLCTSMAITSLATASDSHTAPVRMVVGFPPGGGTDGAARIVSEKLSLELGQSVVVENKAGAGGVIGAQFVAHSPPDGRTIFFGSGAELVINPLTRKKAPYDVLKDFIPITEVGSVKFVLVVPASSPMNSVQALIAQAKAHPGQLNFSSFGVGSTNHLLGELFLSSTGIKATHVPYQGSAPEMNALLAGQVDFSFETAAVALPQIKAGKLKALATPSPARLKELPDVPTLQELGFKDLVAEGWMGVFAPAGTPSPIIQRLNRALVKALHMPDVQAKLDNQGVVVVANTPEEYRKALAVEIEKWRRVVKASGVSLD